MKAVRSVALVLLLIVAWSTSALAQKTPITIEPSGMQPPLVLGRPMLTWWDVKIYSAGLAVGKFKFTIKTDRELLAIAETEELTLNGPQQRIRVLLPSIDTLSSIEQLLVEVSYEGKTFSGRLGDQQVLRVPFATKKTFIALVAESALLKKNSPQRDSLMQRLRFENVVLESKAHRRVEDDQEFIRTVYASIDPADLPAEALSYCSYDMVVVASDEFRSLRKPQLEALLAWTRGGGSLYLEPKGVLEPYHVDFLRNLMADDQQGVVFQVDENGKLIEDISTAEQLGISAVCGIGQIAILTGDLQQGIDVKDPRWRKLVKPLWKARLEPAFMRREKDPLGQISPNGQNNGQGEVNTDPLLLATTLVNRSRMPSEELLERLMPEGVRMIPISVLAFILFTFVVLIGPGDYFVLGWMRLRKLTWITFPLTTLAVTTLTVVLSNSYMTTSESRRFVVLRDLSPRGDLVRTNRFELLYIASARTVTTEVEKGFFAPLKTGRSSPQNSLGMLGYEEDFSLISSQSEGRIPTEYVVRQNLAKWTPQLNRILSIPGVAKGPEVDWSQFNLTAELGDAFRHHVVPSDLVKRAQKEFGQKAMVACFTGLDGWASDNAAGWQSRSADAVMQRYINTIQRSGLHLTNIPEVRHALTSGQHSFFVWVYAASIAFPGTGHASPTWGISALTRQTAPKGGANCDDLALLDPSDPNAWLLVIVVPGENETNVYRKLMRFQ